MALPGPVLALAYGLLGSVIGMRFTMEVLGYAAAGLPRLISGGRLRCLSCARALAGHRAALAHRHPHGLSRDNPGGADSVAIIATGLHVDMSFVMAMQLARFCSSC